MGASISAAPCASSTAPPPSSIIFVPSPTVPEYDKPAKFDPNYGFEGKRRKERVPPLTKEQLASAKVEPKYRDFCVHKMLEFRKCNKDNFPWVMKCHHAKHEYEHCQYEEYIIRMKEYERERRLLHRQARKEKIGKKCGEEQPEKPKC